MPLWLVLVLFFASCVVFIAYQAAARENPLFYPLAAAFAAGFALLVGLGWRRKAPAAFSVRRCLPFAARRAAHTFDQEA